MTRLNLAPAWREAASELLGIVKFGAISCRDYRRTCHNLQIQSYPTLMLFRTDGQRYQLYQGEKKVRQSQGKYKGARHKEALVEYALENVTPKFRTLSDHGFGLFMGRPTLYILSDADGDYSVKDFPDFYQIQAALSHLCNIVQVPCHKSISDQSKSFCQKRTSDEGGIFFFETGKNPSRDEGVPIPSFLADIIIDRVYDEIRISEIESVEDFRTAIQEWRK